VLVQLQAAALNHIDLYPFGTGQAPPEWEPYVGGVDGAGVVAALGADVAGWSVGDQAIINPVLFCGDCVRCQEGEHSLCVKRRLLGVRVDGTFTEYMRIPARNLVPKPPHLSTVRAAALPMALGTAWRALVTRAGLKQGETVLIHGIGGGVALFGLQIATALGARVIVTSSSADKLARAQALGASHGINYRDEDVVRRVRELTGSGADVVMDAGGARTMPLSIQAVRPGGRIVHFGTVTGTEANVDLLRLFSQQISVIGTSWHSRTDLADALALVSTREMNPVVSSEFALADGPGALEHLRRGAQFGKVVLRMN
jgi:NADPH:quinone reductase-like Zn-dependent oxidoreductase